MSSVWRLTTFASLSFDLSDGFQSVSGVAGYFDHKQDNTGDQGASTLNQSVAAHAFRTSATDVPKTASKILYKRQDQGPEGGNL